jgi:hypothetical protein
VYTYAQASPDFRVFSGFLKRGNLPVALTHLSTTEQPEVLSSQQTQATPATAPVPGAATVGQLAAEQTLASVTANAAAAAVAAVVGTANAAVNAAVAIPREVSQVSVATIEGAAGAQHPELSRELAWKHARENVIIVTWTNYHFYDFIANWVAHISNHRTISCPALLHGAHSCLFALVYTNDRCRRSTKSINGTMDVKNFVACRPPKLEAYSEWRCLSFNPFKRHVIWRVQCLSPGGGVAAGICMQHTN